MLRMLEVQYCATPKSEGAPEALRRCRLGREHSFQGHRGLSAVSSFESESPGHAARYQEDNACVEAGYFGWAGWDISAWRRFSSTLATAYSRPSCRIVLRSSAAIDASRPVSSSCQWPKPRTHTERKNSTVPSIKTVSIDHLAWMLVPQHRGSHNFFEISQTGMMGCRHGGAQLGTPFCLIQLPTCAGPLTFQGWANNSNTV